MDKYSSNHPPHPGANKELQLAMNFLNAVYVVWPTRPFLPIIIIIRVTSTHYTSALIVAWRGKTALGDLTVTVETSVSRRTGTYVEAIRLIFTTSSILTGSRTTAIEVNLTVSTLQSRSVHVYNIKQ